MQKRRDAALSLHEQIRREHDKRTADRLYSATGCGSVALDCSTVSVFRDEKAKGGRSKISINNLSSLISYVGRVLQLRRCRLAFFHGTRSNMNASALGKVPERSRYYRSR